jgi:predicted nucleic acid-binding protein
MILDTSFLIDAMRGKPAAAGKLKELVASRTPLAVATPSLFELFSGVAQSSKPAAELERIHGILHQQMLWPLDAAAAEQAGKVHGALGKEGRPIGSVDALIAGIALEHREPVLTRNTKEFSRVSGLRVESY